MNAAGAVLDDDQGAEAPQQHGVHVDEIDREDAVGVRGEELLPGRACAAGRGVDPRSIQDLPHRGSCDPVAELDEFTLHAPVPHVGLSAAMRMTSFRMAAAMGGRPGRRRLV